MTKAELIKALSTRTGMSQRAVTELVEAFVDVVVEAVKGGDEVRIAKLGKFLRRLRKGGARRVPGTDRVVNVPDKYVPVFKPARQFKEEVK